MITFEQFVATGRDVPDLDRVVDGCETEGPGRTYLDDTLYISRWTNGLWNLQIYGREEISKDLSILEQMLYDWACDEGYCDDEDDETRKASDARADAEEQFYKER